MTDPQTTPPVEALPSPETHGIAGQIYILAPHTMDSATVADLGVALTRIRDLLASAIRTKYPTEADDLFIVCESVGPKDEPAATDVSPNLDLAIN